MDEPLRTQLLTLQDRDRAKRQELVERGELFDGYHPEMEQVHEENARILEDLVRRQGWPRLSEVGDEGALAAWMVANNAIGKPGFQRMCLEQLKSAVEAGEAPAKLWAALTDRIRFNERRPQVYGTLMDWDEEGRLSPWRIEDAEHVDERRRDVGLEPLEEKVQEARERVRQEGGRAPKTFAERQAEIAEWARRVGWLGE